MRNNRWALEVKPSFPNNYYNQTLEAGVPHLEGLLNKRRGRTAPKGDYSNLGMSGH